MKTIKSLVCVLLLALVIFSCEKTADNAILQQNKPSFTMDGLTNTLWRSDCDKPYDISLFHIIDLGGGKYQWIWGVANPNGASTLTRISFSIPPCVKYENPKYFVENQMTDGLLRPATIIPNDATYSRCLSNGTVSPNLLSFIIPTNGTGTTYFNLTLNTNKFSQVTAYFQNNNGECGTTCFPGIKDECKSCSFSQGRYFSSPHRWPAPGTVTLGGKTYMQAEGRAIWRSSNRGGISDAKKAFHQAAAIKLSASTISSSASVWADVKIIEDWLASLPKLTPFNHYQYSNRAAAQAAGRIGNWIDKNHCKESNDDKDDDDDDKKKKRG